MSQLSTVQVPVVYHSVHMGVEMVAIVTVPEL